jgi:hypothetical protein
VWKAVRIIAWDYKHSLAKRQVKKEPGCVPLRVVI